MLVMNTLKAIGTFCVCFNACISNEQCHLPCSKPFKLNVPKPTCDRGLTQDNLIQPWNWEREVK